ISCPTISMVSYCGRGRPLWQHCCCGSLAFAFCGIVRPNWALPAVLARLESSELSACEDNRTSRRVLECPVLALSGDALAHCKCPLSGGSGQRYLRCNCRSSHS